MTSAASSVGSAESSTHRKRSKWDHERDTVRVVSPQPPSKRRHITMQDADVSPSLNTSPKRPAAQSVFVPPRTRHPPLTSSRSVYSYEKLNSIEEGSYGVVFRARDKQTGDIVALKKLKLDEEKYGFPITALREINALMLCRHDNVVGIREVVVGETLTQYAL
jgi:cell division cycle 2-like protein